MTPNWNFRILALLSATLLSLALGYAARNVAPAVAIYDGAPRFESVNGTPLSYAGDSPQEIIHSANVYYLRDQGAWFISSYPQGPWQLIRGVPRDVAAVACTRIGDANSPFQGNDQLCVGPLPKVRLAHFWSW